MLKTNAINGLPSIGLNNKVAHLKTAVDFPDSEQNVSVYIVAKQKIGAGSLSDGNGTFLTTGGNSITIARNYTNGTNTNITSYFKFVDITAPAVPEDTFLTISSIFGPNDQKLYINEILKESKTDGIFDAGADKLHLFTNELDSNRGNKDIAEVLIYTSKHDSTERAQVETYLKDKYGHY